jgi:nitroreductase
VVILKSKIKCDFLSMARRRFTAFEFSSRPVSPAAIKRILEAARFAPSFHNAQLWKFIVVVDKPQIGRLMELCHYGFFHGTPAAMVVIVLEPIGAEIAGLSKGELKAMTEQHRFMCISLPALNMQYQAECEGISSAILSLVADKANRILGVPKGSQAVLVVTLGYPGKGTYERPKERKALSAITYSNRYGKKW